jgi:hypothetical protein
LTTLVYPTTLVAGANENVNDLNSNLNAITAVINGAIDSSNIANAGVSANNLSTALAQFLGITNVANTGRGKSIIATSEARTNTAYGTLTTPDQVTGIVLPTDGLIFVAYQAIWQESVNAAANAAIFVGANQVSMAATNGTAPIAQAASINTTVAAVDKPLASSMGGLVSNNGLAQGSVYAADVTTGQMVGVNTTNAATFPIGGPCVLFAAAGTYTVSVQFKASSGSVTAKSRKLWVWTQGF